MKSVLLKIICRVFAIFAVAVLVLCACTSRTRHEAAFSRARAVMDSLPETALVILDSIPAAELQPGLDSARYILLHALAENKAHALATPDSLLQAAIDVFRENGETTDLRNANYILGSSLDYQERYSEAIVKLLDAENLIDDSTPPYEKGLIYNGIADCCNSTLNGALALKYIDKATEAFTEASKPLHAAYALYGKATYLNNNGNFTDAEPLFTRIQLLADSLNDLGLRHAATSGLGYAYLGEGKDSTALQCFNRLPQDYLMDDPQTLALTARTELRAGNKDLADSLSRRLLGMGDYRWIYAIDPSQTTVEEIISAYKAQDESTERLYVDAYHDAFPTILERNLTLYKEVSTFRIRFQTVLIIALSLGLILLITLGYYLIRNYRRKVKAKENTILELSSDFLSFMREQENRLKETQPTHDDPTGLTRSMLNKQMEMLHALVHSYYGRPAESKETLRELTKFIDKLIADLRNNPDTSKELVELVNLCQDNIITRLQEEIPSLRKEDIRLFCYLASGMSTHTIMRIYELTTPHMLANRKYRLKKKLMDANPPSLSEFLRYL